MELAAVDREMIIDDTAVKFGFDTALIPLEPAKSRRWHFLVTEGKQITPGRLKREIKKWGLCRRDEIAEGDLKGNVYVGWCGYGATLMQTGHNSELQNFRTSKL
jgi:hypothetical protein